MIESGFVQTKNYKELYYNLTGFALGVSFCSLFGRIIGGIFNKAADIGADLLKKDSRLK